MTKTEILYAELSKTVAMLEERLDNARSETNRVDAERSKAADSLTETIRKLAVMEDHVKELKKIAEERDRRRWAIFLAVVGCLLTLAANIGLTYIRFHK